MTKLKMDAHSSDCAPSDLDLKEKAGQLSPSTAATTPSSSPRGTCEIKGSWMTTYISDEGRKNLPKYTYSGSDNSLMYIYFASPLAEMMVRRFVPLWLAPNIITCLGLIPSLFGHLLIMIYSPDLQASCPSWVWAVNGACTLIYQTLDNMDGKQARRTQTSSPLGLMIDHGVDALNIVLSTINLMALLQVGGSNAACFAMYCASTLPFFFATWEEYHTGSLFLGAFNGPTDGVLIIAASYFATAFVGDQTQFWSAELAYGVSRRTFMISFFSFCVVVTLLDNIRRVKNVSSRGQRKLLAALLQTVPFCMSLAGGAIALSSNSGAEAFKAQPRTFYWCLGSIFLLLVVYLQLAHICSESYHPWKRIFIAPLLLVPVFFALDQSALVDHATTLLLMVTGILAASWLHLVSYAYQEMAEILGIHIFSISTSVKID
eukprot:TRINITY_DN13916_c0_g1_i2.p1 TRINITY_DN13916_c0_g1~~TRINITY_DN13916_c0_g1_i2.p1  ORF type:complete len:446 (-),score=52.53 TRINITY_DN13916_c0_g1_i2:109-1404(-)